MHLQFASVIYPEPHSWSHTTTQLQGGVSFYPGGHIFLHIGAFCLHIQGGVIVYPGGQPKMHMTSEDRQEQSFRFLGCPSGHTSLGHVLLVGPFSGGQVQLIGFLGRPSGHTSTGHVMLESKIIKGLGSVIF